MNTREWGGVDALIEKFACFLAKKNIDFIIIDFKNSRLRDCLPWVTFSDVKDDVLANLDITHVLVPSVAKLRDPLFPWKIFSKAKVLTWIVHPNDPFRSFFPFSGYFLDKFGYGGVAVLKNIFKPHYFNVLKLFENLVSGNALVVMDGATHRALHYFFPEISSSVDCIPIPSTLSFESKSKLPSNEVISFGYLGRVDSFKWSALKGLVSHDFSNLSVNRSVEFHVIAEGTHLKRLKTLCEKKGIKFFSYGYLPNDEAKKVICKHTNVAVAMGTSALDIAGTGHPCIVIDPVLGLFSKRQRYFRYIHESSDYTLGEYRDIPHYVNGMNYLVDLISNENLKKATSMSRQYVALNHNPENCFDKLLSCIYNSNITINDAFENMKVVEASFTEIKLQPFKYVAKNFLYSVSRV